MVDIPFYKVEHELTYSQIPDPGGAVSFTPVGELERSLYGALVILTERLVDTEDEKFRSELQEVNEALVLYHDTKECAGGVWHEWDFAEACATCKAPDGDCQNFHTIWCPECLGCAEVRDEEED